MTPRASARSTARPRKTTLPAVGTALLLSDVINDLDFPEGEALLAQALPMAPPLARLEATSREAEVPRSSTSTTTTATGTRTSASWSRTALPDVPGGRRRGATPPETTTTTSSSRSTRASLDQRSTRCSTASAADASSSPGIAAHPRALHGQRRLHARAYSIYAPADCIVSNTVRRQHARPAADRGRASRAGPSRRPGWRSRAARKARVAASDAGSRGWLRDWSLTLTMLALFAVCAAGQVLAGWCDFNQTATAHGEARSRWPPIHRGHLWEALFENWESEFLQMAPFVAAHGLPLSDGIARVAAADATDWSTPTRATSAICRTCRGRSGAAAGCCASTSTRSASRSSAVPGVVRRPRSAAGGATAPSSGARRVGPGSPTTSTSSRFWFESFQNWQSEFLSVGAMVWLAVYLRQRGSPESKPVHAPHDETGR